MALYMRMANWYMFDTLNRLSSVVVLICAIISNPLKAGWLQHLLVRRTLPGTREYSRMGNTSQACAIPREAVWK